MAREGWFGAELGPAKTALKELAEATHALNMNECARQVLLQLRREKERLGIDSFTYSDITISVPSGCQLGDERREVAA